MRDDGRNGVDRPKHHDPGVSPMHEVQRAEVSLMLTKHSGLRAEIEITNRGLLSVAALVFLVLLSTAVLVNVALLAGRRRRCPRTRLAVLAETEIGVDRVGAYHRRKSSADILMLSSILIAKSAFLSPFKSA